MDNKKALDTILQLVNAYKGTKEEHLYLEKVVLHIKEALAEIVVAPKPPLELK